MDKAIAGHRFRFLYQRATFILGTYSEKDGGYMPGAKDQRDSPELYFKQSAPGGPVGQRRLAP